jgi:ribonuclease HI
VGVALSDVGTFTALADNGLGPPATTAVLLSVVPASSSIPAAVIETEPGRTNNTYAIQMACDYVTPMAPPQVIFLSDSQSSIEALTNPFITSRTVLRTATALNTLAKQVTEVWIQWVRGHNGSDGNELADHMANLGAAFQAEGPEPFLPLSRAVIKMTEREELLQAWTNRWKSQKEFRQTRLFFPEPNMATSKNILLLSRQEIGMLIRNITGHSYLNYHQSLIQRGLIDPVCGLCGTAREESHHLIRSCAALAIERLKCLWQIEIMQDTWFISSLLQFLQTPKMAILEDHTWSDYYSPPPRANAPLAATPTLNRPPNWVTPIRTFSQRQIKAYPNTLLSRSRSLN